MRCERKQNVFDDLIAAAEYLVRERADMWAFVAPHTGMSLGRVEAVVHSSWWLRRLRPESPSAHSLRSG